VLRDFRFEGDAPQQGNVVVGREPTRYRSCRQWRVHGFEDSSRLVVMTRAHKI
jgi:hypothetical protein